ncbi:MAG: transporter [Deltaproteobacteria bacterium]|nr:transporter [Deltaproteobacteria bacterium]
MQFQLLFVLPFHPIEQKTQEPLHRGGFGLELGNAFTNSDGGKENIITLTLIYGLANWIETDIDFAFLTVRPDSGQNESGFGDILFLLKLKIPGESGILSGNEFLPDLVLEPSISIPTGDEDKGLGLGETRPGLLLAVEETFWRKLAGRANLGYFATNLDDDYKDKFFYGFQIDFPLLTERLRLGSELTGEFGSDDANPLFTLVGLVFQINDKIALNGGVEFGLKDAQSSVTGIVGVTFGF